MPMIEDRDNLWWPEGLRPETDVVMGSNQHNKIEYGRTVGRTNDHLFTLKQTRERVIWACACGKTLSRLKVVKE